MVRVAPSPGRCTSRKDRSSTPPVYPLRTIRRVNRLEYELFKMGSFRYTHHVYLIICKTYILSVAAAPLTSLVPERIETRRCLKKKKKKKKKLNCRFYRVRTQEFVSSSTERGIEQDFCWTSTCWNDKLSKKTAIKQASSYLSVSLKRNYANGARLCDKSRDRLEF